MGQNKKSDLSRLLLALCISLYVWGYVTNMHNPMQTKSLTNVPIVFENVDSLASKELAIDFNSKTTTTVVVEGRYSNMQNVSPEDVSVTVDMKDLALKKDINTVALVVKSKNTNLSIVKEKTPLQAEINIVELSTKEVPIILNITGKLENGYISGGSTLSKETAIFSGTKKDLENIKYALAIVDLDNFNEDIKRAVNLRAISKEGDRVTNVTLKGDPIEVFIPVYYSKEVPIEIKYKNDLRAGYEIKNASLNFEKITIVGSKETLDKISNIKTEEINLYGLYNDFDKRASLIYPEGVKSKDNISSVYISFDLSRK